MPRISGKQTFAPNVHYESSESIQNARALGLIIDAKQEILVTETELSCRTHTASSQIPSPKSVRTNSRKYINEKNRRSRSKCRLQKRKSVATSASTVMNDRLHAVEVEIQQDLHAARFCNVLSILTEGL